MRSDSGIIVAGYHDLFCLLMWMRFSVGMKSAADPLYFGLRLTHAICSYFALLNSSVGRCGSAGGRY